MERFDNDQIQSDRRKQELDDLISTTNLQLKREIQILEDINNNVIGSNKDININEDEIELKINKKESLIIDLDKEINDLTKLYKEATGDNVNADTVAATIAHELNAEKLILMTSVPGILEDKNDKTSLISYINHDGLKEMKLNGKLKDGMLPKVDADGLALDNGVARVHIISSNTEDSLLTEVFTNHGTGTLIVNDLKNLTTNEQLGESNEATVG